MQDEVLSRAAIIEAEFGPDVTEALRRWQLDGASLERGRPSLWVSVAFLFSRRHRRGHSHGL